MFMDPAKKINATSCQFIVVHEKFTEKVAQSLCNRAAEKGIKCVVWDEKNYDSNKQRLTNRNHVLFLCDKYIETNLTDPTIKSHQIIDGAFYKKQGCLLGIYIDNKAGALEKTLYWASGVFTGGGLIGAFSQPEPKSYKDVIIDRPNSTCNNKGGFVPIIIAAALAIGPSMAALAYRVHEKNRFNLLMKAVKEFDKTYLLDFIQGKL